GGPEHPQQHRAGGCGNASHRGLAGVCQFHGAARPDPPGGPCRSPTAVGFPPVCGSKSAVPLQWPVTAPKVPPGSLLFPGGPATRPAVAPPVASRPLPALAAFPDPTSGPVAPVARLPATGPLQSQPGKQSSFAPTPAANRDKPEPTVG